MKNPKKIGLSFMLAALTSFTLPVCAEPNDSQPAQTAASDATTRIFGGSTASEQDWPFAVSLFSDTIFGVSFRCTASLISKKHILTAAHCVVPPIEQGRRIYVSVGLQSLASSIEIPVENITVHPEYRSYKADDIAILELPFTLADSLPVALASSRIMDGKDTGDKLTVAGWGYRDGSAFIPTQLFEAKVPLAANRTCESLASTQGGANQTLSRKHHCTLVVNNVGTCNGDSGGPVIVEASSGKRYQAAVTNYTQKKSGSPDRICNTAENFGLFNAASSIAYYSRWIYQTITGIDVNASLTHVGQAINTQVNHRFVLTNKGDKAANVNVIGASQGLTVTENTCQAQINRGEQCIIAGNTSVPSEGRNEQFLSVALSHPDYGSLNLELLANTVGRPPNATNAVTQAVNINDINVYAAPEQWQTSGNRGVSATNNSSKTSVLELDGLATGDFSFDYSLPAGSAAGTLWVMSEKMNTLDRLPALNNGSFSLNITESDESIAIVYEFPSPSASGQPAAVVRNFKSGGYLTFSALIAIMVFGLTTSNKRRRKA
ncbi:hypothetical protein CS022_13065 [Veronia nyctiphanis]|uniref:Peptidase S1 domain-containing protein n=1 Tax=Veronia nyctiphanis TaxID=1278244 RepID=A0A4Q0YUS3_9GAMM|nr:serine protease [Veronia nyctiphanis]RXJ72791.1 hypothetical protein CS022_13065 [Veronia nyctiphanis]